MESENLIDINNQKTLSPIIFLVVILIFISSGVVLSVTARKLPKLKSRNILYGVHKQFPIFCIFLGQAICLLLYFMKLSLIKKMKIEWNKENLWVIFTF